MRKQTLIAQLTLVFCLSVSAQPSVDFRSTSTMVSSGSAYASQPMLNENGTAVCNGTSDDPVHAPSGPRRVGPVTPEGNPTPIGDGVLILVGMALAYVVFQKMKNRKSIVL